jgi:hypothetical protein
VLAASIIRSLIALLMGPASASETSVNKLPAYTRRRRENLKSHFMLTKAKKKEIKTHNLKTILV